MNDIERFLDRACCGVGGSPELRRHLREELREHLEEEIERNVAAGMAQGEAIQKAIEEFGDPGVIRDGLQTVHGRRVTALLIEKSMAWREKTMKTGWKWSFVACVMLILTIAAQVYFAIAAMMYIVPSLRSWHDQVGTPMFGCLETVVQLTGWLLYDQYWIPWLWLVLGLGGAVFFERRYRGENKSVVRLAGLSLVSFVMLLVLATVCVPLTIDLAILPGQIYELQVNLSPQQAEKILLPKIAEGEAALKDLGQAIEREDWPAAGSSAARLSDTYRSLRDIGNATFVLAGENQRNNLDDIRYLIDEIWDSSREVRNRFRAYDRSKSETEDDSGLKPSVQPHFEQLEEIYTELRAKSDLFAAAGKPSILPARGKP